MKQDITTEDKIDYIYSRLKKQERYEKITFILRWGFRIFIIGYLIYFYQVVIPKVTTEIYDKLTPNIDIESSEIIDTVKDYIPNFGGGL